MASVIATVGDEVIMPSNSMLMIHNPWGAIGGNADTLISFGEALAKMRESIAAAYVAKSGMDVEDVYKLMDKETWLDAYDAVDLGLADRVDEPRQMAALVNTSKFQNTPLAIRQMTADWKPRSYEDIAAKAYQKFNRRGP